MILDWKGLIPICLTIVNEANRYEYVKKNKKIHLLIVEGSSDKNFYHLVLNFDIMNDDKKKYRFNISEKNIMYDISNCFIDVKRPDQMYLNKMVKELKDNYESLDNNLMYKYDFVIECINKYLEMEEKLKYIDCYGIIDRDFGHKVSEEKMSITATHDFETNLIRCYMDDYFELLDSDSRSKALLVLTNAIDFSFRQGILERESFKYVQKNPEMLNRTIVNFTHNTFKYGSKTTDFSNYDFDSYLEEYNVFYKELIENYKKEIELVYTFKDELQDILKRWLIEKNPSTVDEKRLDRIFQYVNGHILMNQLILNGKDLFKLSNDLNEEIFINNFIEKIIKIKYQRIYKTLPLKKYKDYRIEKGYYTLI